MNLENDYGGDDASSSRYSSCGESEFERYSSANSAMGTPSVCSSITVFNDFPELELGGSSRSLRLGLDAENGGLESFAFNGEKKIRGGAKRLSDETSTSTSANYGLSGFELYGNESDEISFSGFNNGLVNSWNEVKCDPRPSKGSSDSEKQDRSEDCDDEEVIPSLDPSYGEEKVEEMEGREDGESSRDEHSEGEDSMYNGGTDNEEKRVEIDDRYGNRGRSVEAKTRNENPLLINSSVAFGSEDWDDFELESGGLAMPLDSLNLGIFHETEEKRIRESKREVLNSIPSVNIAVSSSQIEAFDELDDIIDKSVARIGFWDSGKLLEEEDVKNIPVASCQVQGGVTTEKVEDIEKEDSGPITYTENSVQGGDGLVDFPKTNVAEESPEKISFEKRNDVTPHGKQTIHDTRDFVKPNTKFGRVGDLTTDPISSSSTTSSQNTALYMLEDSRKKAEPSMLRNDIRKNVILSGDHRRKHPMPVKTEAREQNEFYDEVVLEMEEILLASNESPGGARFPHHSSNRALQSQLSLPVRDGGASASTSGTDDAYPFSHQPLRIDGVEVVGARQKKGDVSLGERLVGVKEYTLYNIRVWSGDDQWEIERRYRDFSTLYHRLKTIFAGQGFALPSQWDTVERESRKIFGNSSPSVVSERSVLIQECLHSILRPRFFAISSSALAWFLCPRDSAPSSPASSTTVSQSVYNIGNRDGVSTLGKTISLIVEIQPYKSVKQMLESQHYTCAGCYKHLDNGNTLIRDFAQTFGFGKPRLCEYTSQLFCSSCHANETAVLPARVLHNWDFAQYPVSQMAKSYLDSIHDQPMLCVSAVNPFLFSKVPTLHHVMGVRRKIGSILASYVRCSFRGSINRGLGSRRYLLESNDFFALRDLIDLSKGAFAVLPVMIETVLKKIVEHITDQCLVCCDVGVPCGARQACNDPSSLIFPFQEGNVEKCPSCESEFHKACFRKLTECHCGIRLRTESNTKLAKRLSRGVGGESSRGALEFLGKGLGSNLSVGFFSGLLNRATVKPERSFIEHRNGDNVILMGSLPSTTL